jgi:hypothetical protein
MASQKQNERAEAIARLREILKPGDRVTTTVLHVSRSGMSRSIMCQAVMKDSNGHSYIGDISWLVARACGDRLDDRGGVVMGGCGMNMCFAVVYNLGRVLFPQGFGIEGTRANGRKVRAKSKAGANRMAANGVKFRGRNCDSSGWDNDGGYALQYR